MNENDYGGYVKQQNEFIKWMSRHLVGLSGTYFPLDQEEKAFRTKEQVFCFPGFVLALNGHWHYVTAGHNLLDVLEDYVKKGWIKLTGNFAFLDYFGPDAKVKEKTVFDYDRANKLRIDQKDLGIDFALIPLDDYYKLHLEANGVIPFERKHWIGTNQIEFSFYAMLGFPEDLMEPCSRVVQNREQVGLDVCATLVLIKRLERAPDGIDAPGGDWLIGEVSAPISMKGMSGGPVFGFRQRDNGRWEYRLVAVQSRWFKDHRVIYASAISPVMHAIGGAIQKWLEEEASGNSTDVKSD
ncbi:MAG TPA: hypothetical protein VK395_10480 [Gemmataceae bacterium]|nr:hypothetical protein [Gemmataceae bacterium]